MSEAAVDEGFEATEPGFGANVSPDDDTVTDAAEAAESEQVEASENEADSPPADEENVEKKIDPVQDRINELTKKFREAERALGAKDERVEALERQLADLKASRAEEPLKTLADFEYNEQEYHAYVLEHTQQVARQAALDAARELQAPDTSEIVEKYNQRESDFAKTVDDFHDKVYAEDLVTTATMVDTIRSLDNGPEVAYYLANNPIESKNIAGMSDAQAGMSIGRISDRLAAAAANAKAANSEVSKAPKPPAKITGAGQSGKKPSTTDPASDKMSDKEWFAREEARQAKLRGR